MVLYQKNKIWDVADSLLYFEITILSFFRNDDYILIIWKSI